MVHQAEHQSPDHALLLRERELHELHEPPLHCPLPLPAHRAALRLVHEHLAVADEVLEGVRGGWVLLLEVVLALLVRGLGEAADEGERRGGPRVVETDRVVVELEVGPAQFALGGALLLVILGEERRRDGLLHGLREVLYEELAVPGEERVELGHELEADEEAGHGLGEAGVGVADALDVGRLGAPLGLVLAEHAPLVLALGEQADELAVVDQRLLGADQRVDDQLLDLEDDARVSLALQLQAQPHRVHLPVLDDQQLAQQDAAQQRGGDLEVEDGVRDEELGGEVGVARLVAEQEAEVRRDVQDVLVVLQDASALRGLGAQDVGGELVELVLDDQHQHVPLPHRALHRLHRPQEGLLRHHRPRLPLAAHLPLQPVHRLVVGVQQDRPRPQVVQRQQDLRVRRVLHRQALQREQRAAGLLPAVAGPRPVQLAPPRAQQRLLDVVERVEGGVEAEGELLEVVAEALLDLGLLLEVQRAEDLEVQRDQDGGGLAVLAQCLVLGEAVVPVVDLLVEVLLDELCVLELARVDVGEFLQRDELVPDAGVVLLDDAGLLFLHVQLALLARQLRLRALQLAAVLLYARALALQRGLQLVELDDAVDPPHHVPHPERHLRHVVERPLARLLDAPLCLRYCARGRRDGLEAREKPRVREHLLDAVPVFGFAEENDHVLEGEADEGVRVGVVTEFGKFSALEGEDGVVGLLQDGLGAGDLLLDLAHHLLDLSLAPLELALLGEHQQAHLLARLLLPLQHRHHLPQPLRLLPHARLHLADLRLQPLEDLCDLVYLEDGAVEDVLALAGVVGEPAEVLDEAADHLVVEEGVVLEVQLVAAAVLPLQRAQVRVHLQEQARQPLPVPLLRQARLQDLVRHLQDRLSRHLLHQPHQRLLPQVVALPSERRRRLGRREQQQLDAPAAQRHEVRDHLVVGLGLPVVGQPLGDRADLRVSVLAVLGGQQLLRRGPVGHLLQEGQHLAAGGVVDRDDDGVLPAALDARPHQREVPLGDALLLGQRLDGLAVGELSGDLEDGPAADAHCADKVVVAALPLQHAQHPQHLQQQELRHVVRSLQLLRHVRAEGLPGQREGGGGSEAAVLGALGGVAGERPERTVVLGLVLVLEGLGVGHLQEVELPPRAPVLHLLRAQFRQDEAEQVLALLTEGVVNHVDVADHRQQGAEAQALQLLPPLQPRLQALLVGPVVDPEVLHQQAGDSVHLQLVGGPEVRTHPRLAHRAPDQLCENGSDGVLVGGRQGEFREVAGEPGVEVLAVGGVAVGDEDVPGERHHFLGPVTEDLLVFGGEAEELAHLLAAEMDVVHEYQHRLRLPLFLLPAHPLLHRARHALRPRPRVHAHPQQVLGLGVDPEDLLEGVRKRAGLAGHWLATPEHVFAVLVGVQVDVLAEAAAEGGDVDLPQVPDLLERLLELEELALAVPGEAEAVVEDGLLADDRVVFVEVLLHALAQSQQLDAEADTLLEPDRLGLGQLLLGGHPPQEDQPGHPHDALDLPQRELGKDFVQFVCGVCAVEGGEKVAKEGGPGDVLLADEDDVAAGDGGGRGHFEVGRFEDDLEVVVDFEARAVGEREQLGVVQQRVEVLDRL